MVSIRHLLLFNIMALLMSGFCVGFLFYAAQNYLDSANNIDYEALIDKTKNSEDIEWLKDGMLLMLEQRNTFQAEVADSYSNFGELLIAFVLFYAFNVVVAYKLHKKHSNKSSNLTGAENAPPS